MRACPGVFYSELKELYGQNDLYHDEEAAKKAAEITRELVQYGWMARKEGILSIDGEATEKDDILARAFLHILDCCNPEVVEELAISEYLAGYSKAEPVERLVTLMQIVGALHIQAGENPYVLKDRLIAMAPFGTRAFVEEMEEKEAESRPSSVEDNQKFTEKLIANVCSAEPNFSAEEIIEKLTDNALRYIDPRCIQRMMQNVDVKDLEVAMKGLSGEANKKIIGNMSGRMAARAAMDMDFMGPVRLKDVETACSLIMGVLLRLEDAGEIVWPDAHLYEFSLKLFEDAKRSKRKQVKEDYEKKEGLLRILESYLNTHTPE